MKKRCGAGKINRELFEEAQKKIDEAMALLKPWLDNYFPPESSAAYRYKVDRETLVFLALSNEIAVKFPEMFPPFHDQEAFSEDYDAINELWVLASQADKLKDFAGSMLNLYGNDILDTAFFFYNTLKVAAKRDFPGARIIFDELKTAYPVKKRKKLKGY